MASVTLCGRQQGLTGFLLCQAGQEKGLEHTLYHDGTSAKLNCCASYTAGSLLNLLLNITGLPLRIFGLLHQLYRLQGMHRLN